MSWFRARFPLLLAGIFGLSIHAIAEENGPVAVRFIVPLSGEAASYGTATRDGAQMAYESLSDGDRKLFQISFDDDNFKPSQTVSAFQKSVSLDHASAVVCFGSATSKAISSLAESAHVPLIALASDPTVPRGKHWVVNLWVSPDTESERLIPEAVRRGVKKVGLITTEHDGALSIRQAFLEKNGNRLNVAVDEQFSPDTTDFKPFFGRIRGTADLDAFVLVLLPPQLGAFARQARQLHFQQHFIGYETFEDPSEVKASNGALLDQWYVTGDDPSESFRDKYLKRFPDGAPAVAAAGHDAVILVRNALLSAEPGKAKDAIREYITSAKDISGAMGIYSASGDNRFTLKSVIKVVRANGFEKFIPPTEGGN